MKTDKKTNGIRVVVTKKGTYIIWHDDMYRAVRRLNLSKTQHGKYLGTGGRQR